MWGAALMRGRPLCGVQKRNPDKFNPNPNSSHTALINWVVSEWNLRESHPRRLEDKKAKWLIESLQFPLQSQSNYRKYTGSSDSSLSSRSFMSPNFVIGDRAHCFTWSPNHEEHHRSLMLRAWFLHRKNTQSVQTGGIWTPNLRIGVPASCVLTTRPARLSITKRSSPLATSGHFYRSSSTSRWTWIPRRSYLRRTNQQTANGFNIEKQMLGVSKDWEFF